MVGKDGKTGGKNKIMKLISWNVNGFRACLGKGFADFFAAEQADVFCLQETKMQPGQVEFLPEGYFEYWNSAEKKGYSGTAVFSAGKPVSVRYGIGLPEHDREGRVITLEFPEFFLVNVYAPNSQDQLARLSYRLEWEEAFRVYLTGLDEEKPVVVCGDMNVAHEEIDLKNPKTNRKNAGFSDEERAAFGRLLESGFRDTFRMLYPEKEGSYTWWSYRFHARKNNAGWRIDYFLISERMAEQVEDSLIYSNIQGSDHCPVGLLLK